MCCFPLIRLLPLAEKTRWLAAMMVLCWLPMAQANPPHFKHVVIIFLENTNFADALAQPNLGQWAKQGALMTNFHAETHPSQGNYIALVAGSDLAIETDGKVNLDESNVADLLEQKGLTWKTYAEGFPGNCLEDSTYGRYVRKHNPFLSFTAIRYDGPVWLRNLYSLLRWGDSSPRCANITGIEAFGKEPLPNFSLFIPNLDNDGHDTGVAYADKWLGNYWGPLLANPAFMKDTLVVITFDEAGDAENRIFTLLLGPMVKPGEYNEWHNHYSLLRMVEDNWSLGSLGRYDSIAPSINVWK